MAEIKSLTDAAFAGISEEQLRDALDSAAVLVRALAGDDKTALLGYAVDRVVQMLTVFGSPLARLPYIRGDIARTVQDMR